MVLHGWPRLSFSPVLFASSGCLAQEHLVQPAWLHPANPAQLVSPA